MNAVHLTAGLSAILVFAVLPAHAQDPAIALKPVKYAGLAETIVQNRGKVVVVDLWQFL
jgi:hypothetical protein